MTLSPISEAADRFLESDLTMVDVAAALQKRGFEDVAANVLEMGRQRLAADYLQPSAIFDRDFHVLSAINDVNDYAGPGTGYRVEGERWAEIQAIPQAKEPYDFIDENIGTPTDKLIALGPVRDGTRNEILVAVGPAFNEALTSTIGGLSHEDVLIAILTGVAREGMIARMIKVHHTSDCAAIGYIGAQVSGSGIAIGLQSRGTAVIHKRGLAPAQQSGAVSPIAQPHTRDLRGHRPQRGPLRPGPSDQARGRQDRQRRTAAPHRQDDAAAPTRDRGHRRQTADRDVF